MSAALIETINRILNGALDLYNRYKKKKAVDDVGETLSNGGKVDKSNLSFDDLRDKK